MPQIARAELHDKADDIELETAAAEIKLRAQRRIGKISKTLEKGRGKGKGQVLPTGGKYKNQTLKAAGLSTSAANRCEKIASIPDKAEAMRLYAK